MLSSKFIRENTELVKKNLQKRFSSITLEPFEKLEEERLAILREGELLKAERNAASKKVGEMKKNGENADSIMEEMKEVANRIKDLDIALSAIEEKVNYFCLSIPNILSDDVPEGKNDTFNKEVKKNGAPPTFSFTPKDHVDIAENLGFLDMERAAKLAGARFSLLTGKGAKLERALINFMLEENTSRGYTEVLPPIINNRDSLQGTGSLPKFEEDLFKISGWDGKYYLIPTAEVPITNMHRDEILKESELPLRYTAYTPCFRSEAGSAGRDTRGIIRQHQFNKVEIVKFCKPEDSASEHEKLLADSENILQKLGLPYRVVLLCSGDTGFSAHKCYDIEVWLPSRNGYVEISSCSNFGPFQGTRANIRYKNEESGKNITVHTINGSSLAVGRTMVAILENFQNADGSVTIPPALVPFTGFSKLTK